MSLFSFIGDLFKPAADLVDNLHTSDEERGEIEIKLQQLKANLAEIESKVAIKMLELQQASLDAQAKMAQAEQQHGNFLSKSWRPLTSLVMVGIVVAMAFNKIPYNELMLQIAGAFLGIYGFARSKYDKQK